METLAVFGAWLSARIFSQAWFHQLSLQAARKQRPIAFAPEARRSIVCT
jgi:hypothetical protein